VGTSPALAPDLMDARATRRALAGFFLSGVLAAFFGAILPAWGRHLDSDYSATGNYFLSASLGVVLSTEVARRILARKGLVFVMIVAPALACATLLSLTLASPPVSAWFRMAGLFFLGLATGGLNTGLCRALLPVYRRDSAATLNLAGISFGMGCVAVALLVAGTFYAYTVAAILVFIAVLPGLLSGVYARTSWYTGPVEPEPTLKETLRDFRSFGAVLLALILFFQFGNEWSIAGWLPIFLCQRIGMSPTAALLFLALYWLALLVGRGFGNFLLQRMRYRWLLISSASAALFGCVILLFTNNQFGVGTGVVLLGGGFGPVYPLIAGKIGDRYRYYRPGFFNGIFSLAFTGGLLAPWSLGLLADAWGIGVVLGLPMAGTVVVILLVILVWLEAKFHG